MTDFVSDILPERLETAASLGAMLLAGVKIRYPEIGSQFGLEEAPRCSPN